MTKLLKPADVAEVLQVSVRKARDLMAEMTHMEKPLRVREEALQAWILSKTTTPGEKSRGKGQRMTVKDCIGSEAEYHEKMRALRRRC